jgi:hypothetical protein
MKSPDFHFGLVAVCIVLLIPQLVGCRSRTRKPGSTTTVGANEAATVDRDSTVHSGTYSAVVAANNHTCLLRIDGTARCFGGDDSITSDWVKTPKTKFSSIATAERFVCGITATSGAIECWGNCVGDACKPPSGKFLRVALTDEGGCGWINAHSVTCWGTSSVLQDITPLEAGNLKRLAFGRDFAVGIRTDHTLVEMQPDVPHETQPPPAGEFAEIVANITTACALRLDGNKIECWRPMGVPGPAENFTGGGQPEFLGMRNVPTVELSANTYAGCMILRQRFGPASGGAHCSGFTNYAGPTSMSGSFTQIANGSAHACALAVSGQVTCWGRDTFRPVSGTGRQLW